MDWVRRCHNCSREALYKITKTRSEYDLVVKQVLFCEECFFNCEVIQFGSRLRTVAILNWDEEEGKWIKF